MIEDLVEKRNGKSQSFVNMGKIFQFLCKCGAISDLIAFRGTNPSGVVGLHRVLFHEYDLSRVKDKSHDVQKKIVLCFSN